MSYVRSTISLFWNYNTVIRYCIVMNKISYKWKLYMILYNILWFVTLQYHMLDICWIYDIRVSTYDMIYMGYSTWSVYAKIRIIYHSPVLRYRMSTYHGSSSQSSVGAARKIATLFPGQVPGTPDACGCSGPWPARLPLLSVLWNPSRENH